MKYPIMLTLLLGLVSCGSGNLRDSRDENLVPAAQEQRENELINSPDYIDANDVPAREEERAREEEAVVDPAYEDDFYDEDDGFYETDGLYDTDVDGVLD